jgi:hypothetical protein
MPTPTPTTTPTSTPIPTTITPTPTPTGTETWTKNPVNKVIGGGGNGQNLYVCQGNYNGSIHPGKTWDGYNNCNIGLGGVEVAVQNYYYLDSTKKYKWIPNNQQFTNTKVVGGTFKDNNIDKNLYVCQTAYGGGIHPGKTWDGYNNCNIGWGGDEREVNTFNYMTYE